MPTPTLPNADAANIARVRAPTLPAVDWRPIRGSLGAFRAGYEEIEQFVSQLLDEIDAAWQELDAERVHVEESRALATVAVQPGAALLPAVAADSGPEHGESLQRRIAELEEDRFALQAEVEFARNQLAEQAMQMSEERRQAADERASWANELRMLREAIHQQMAAFNAMPLAAASRQTTDGPPGGNENHPSNDPVLGPLLSQFKILQRDAARRREKSS